MYTCILDPSNIQYFASSGWVLSLYNLLELKWALLALVREKKTIVLSLCLSGPMLMNNLAQPPSPY
jgi:hypothetical protein